MQRLPDRPRLDVCGGEGGEGGVTRPFIFEQCDGEPVVFAFDRRQKLQMLRIRRLDFAAPLDETREFFELCKSDGGEDVAHAVVVADLLVLIPRERLAALLAALTRTIRDALVIRQQRTAARRRYDLVAVERKNPDFPGASRPAAIARSAYRLRRIADQHRAIFLAQRRNFPVVAATPIQINRHDHYLPIFGLRLFAERDFDVGGICMPGGIAIHKNHLCAAMESGADGGDECQSRCDYRP